MDFCLNPEPLLAVVLTYLYTAQLLAEFSFESDAQLRAGLFFFFFFVSPCLASRE